MQQADRRSLRDSGGRRTANASHDCMFSPPRPLHLLTFRTCAHQNSHQSNRLAVQKCEGSKLRVATGVETTKAVVFVSKTAVSFSVGIPKPQVIGSSPIRGSRSKTLKPAD
jgi:hypothetical protein